MLIHTVFSRKQRVVIQVAGAAFSGHVTKDRELTTDKKKPVFILMLCCDLMGKKKFSATFRHVPSPFFKKFMAQSSFVKSQHASFFYNLFYKL